MFILNTGRYALAFVIKVKGRDTRIEFDRRRHYLDTGNLASSGVTEISKEVYEELKKQDFFKEQFEKGFFSEVEKPAEVMGDEIKAKDEEIKKLKAELKKVKNGDADKEIEAKDKEIESLKAQLEALTSKTSEESKEEAKDVEDKEAEGF